MADSPATRFSLRITAGADAPASARLFLAATLRTIGVDEELIENARLAISELVTAAVTRTVAGAVEIVFDASTMGVAVAPLDRHDLEPDAALVVAGLFKVTDDASGSVGFIVRPALDA